MLTPEERKTIEESGGPIEQTRIVLRAWAEQYKPEAVELVRANSHMNEAENEPDPPQEAVDRVIDEYLETALSDLEEIDKGTGEMPVKIDVLEHLAGHARRKRPEVPECTGPMTDALVVEFINRVGVNCWVDYAMYTRDLGGSEWRDQSGWVAIAGGGLEPPKEV